MVSSTVARAQRNNDRWFTLASNGLRVPKSVLQDYAAQGDSLSLTILIRVTRQHFPLFCKCKQSWQHKFSFLLETVSKFNVRDTSPELQHEFCVFWNEVVLKAQKNNNRSIPEYILRCICNTYIALHQNTDVVPTRFSTSTSDDDSVLWLPSSYPVCNIPNHHPDSTTHMYKDIVRTTFARDFSLRTLPTSAGSSSARNQVPANVRSTDVPPVDNNFSRCIC